MTYALGYIFIKTKELGIDFMKIRSHSGFSHHLLLPLLAILAVGSIGAYLTFASNAATPTAPAKRGWVDATALTQVSRPKQLHPSRMITKQALRTTLQ